MRNRRPDPGIVSVRPRHSRGLLVGIAQLVERCVVVADVAGSSPVTHPSAIEPLTCGDAGQGLDVVPRLLHGGWAAAGHHDSRPASSPDSGDGTGARTRPAWARADTRPSRAGVGRGHGRAERPRDAVRRGGSVGGRADHRRPPSRSEDPAAHPADPRRRPHRPGAPRPGGHRGDRADRQCRARPGLPPRRLRDRPRVALRPTWPAGSDRLDRISRHRRRGGRRPDRLGVRQRVHRRRPGPDHDGPGHGAPHPPREGHAPRRTGPLLPRLGSRRRALPDHRHRDLPQRQQQVLGVDLAGGDRPRGTGAGGVPARGARGAGWRTSRVRERTPPARPRSG